MFISQIQFYIITLWQRSLNSFSLKVAKRLLTNCFKQSLLNTFIMICYNPICGCSMLIHFNKVTIMITQMYITFQSHSTKTSRAIVSIFHYGHILISIKNITIFLTIVQVQESLPSTIVLSTSHPLRRTMSIDK